MISCLVESSNLLGESPIWDASAKCLWWIDIHGLKLHRYRPDTPGNVHQEWELEQTCGSIGLRDSTSLVAATRTGFGFLFPERGKVEHIVTPLSGASDVRFNDGRNDRRGRFWTGMVQEKRVKGGASLYRFSDQSGQEILSGLTVVNGIAWSPDGRIMYFSDSHEAIIYALDVDPSGDVVNRRVFARYPKGFGTPDGATVDKDGNYWSAGFGGWHLLMFSPVGRVERTIKLPVSHPTSCTFGGPELSILYVTSAKARLNDKERAAQPLAGHLFGLSVGASGLQEWCYDG